MKLKEGFLLRQVSDAYVVIALGDAPIDGVITLNESGALLWRTIENGADSKTALIDALLAEYDVTREIAARDVDIFTEKLRDAGILTD